MKTTIKEITPQWAKNILATRNPHNRPISLERAETYARDMKAGLWRVTHQGIAFDDNGDLWDGQHRLVAVTIAGVPVKMMVTTGLDPKVFDVIDYVRPRTVGQMFRRDGMKNANAIAAVVRAIANWAIGDGGWLQLSTLQTKTIYDLLPKQIDTVVRESRNCISKPKAAMLAPIAFFGTVHPVKAAEFSQKFFTLADVPKRHPAMALATWGKNHPGNISSSIYGCRVCASALWHFDRGNQVEKLYDNQEASDWLLKQNPSVVEQIRKLIA